MENSYTDNREFLYGQWRILIWTMDNSYMDNGESLYGQSS